MVKWSKVLKPKNFGGLGVSNPLSYSNRNDTDIEAAKFGIQI